MSRYMGTSFFSHLIQANSSRTSKFQACHYMSAKWRLLVIVSNTPPDGSPFSLGLCLICLGRINGFHDWCFTMIERPVIVLRGPRAHKPPFDVFLKF